MARNSIRTQIAVPANGTRKTPDEKGTPFHSKTVRVQRVRSPHPGVVLLRPDASGRHATWRARYQDPDTGRLKKERLDPVALPNDAARRRWAIAKSKALALRGMEIDSGAPRATGTALAAAIERYFDDHRHLRERTQDIYRRAAIKLASWGAQNGVTSADDLTLGKLTAFRASLLNEPKHAAAEGGRRGQSKASEETRKPGAVNIDLRSIGTVLEYLRRLALLPRLTSDDIRDGLRKLPLEHERGEFLRTADIRALLVAALAHDAEPFLMTRDEKAGKAEPGKTPRYRPVAPLVAAALFTGARIGELVGLRWDQVDLEAPGEDGKPAGEIHLDASTKTRRGRTIGLEVSPALREILLARRPASGEGLVFDLTPDQVKAAVRRLESDFGAPANWSWNTLRRTCGTFLCCAPGIFSGASAYRSARQLGHSVEIAERHYVGVLRGIPNDARTLEKAMKIDDLVAF